MKITESSGPSGPVTCPCLMKHKGSGTVALFRDSCYYTVISSRGFTDLGFSVSSHVYIKDWEVYQGRITLENST